MALPNLRAWTPDDWQAFDVQFSFEPRLEVAMEGRREYGPDTAGFLQGIPALPPGLEYRMTFDRGTDLYQREDLPRRYTATVTYGDRHRRPITETYVLDLRTFFGYGRLRVKGSHQMAKALEEIATQTKRWTAHFNGIKVYTTDEMELQRRWADENDDE